MMASENQQKGKKRSKAFYRKCAYSNKKQCTGINILKPGIRGFLVMCNHDERSAVRESYNILNEYADNLSTQEKNITTQVQKDVAKLEADDNVDECDDVEQALKKEVEELKTANSAIEKRFQNVATKAKNCVFIRTTLADPTEITLRIMEDIAEKGLKKARYAARILPILGTCKANTKDIEKLGSDVLPPIFSKKRDDSLLTYTVLFKMRNNEGTSCGRESVIPIITKLVKDINPDWKLSWTDYSLAVIVEVVCTTCCVGIAPDYLRLRKYNLQELQQGPKESRKCSANEETDDKTESEISVNEIREGDDGYISKDYNVVENDGAGIKGNGTIAEVKKANNNKLVEDESSVSENSFVVLQDDGITKTENCNKSDD